MEQAAASRDNKDEYAGGGFVCLQVVGVDRGKWPGGCVLAVCVETRATRVVYAIVSFLISPCSLGI